MNEENSRYYTAASRKLKSQKNPHDRQVGGYAVIEVVEYIADKHGKRSQLRLGLRPL